MRKLIILGLLTAVWTLTSCVNDGGQVFGTLPEGVTLAGDKLDVESASYDDVLHELRITWKGEPAKNFKGVQATFKTLTGGTKTIRIEANPKFPMSYKFFTVVTKYPEQVSFRYLWDEDGKEAQSDEISTSDITIKKESASTRFVTMQAPNYTFVPIKQEDENWEEVQEGYNQMAGKTDAAKRSFFTGILKSVLSAAYYSTVDGGENPVKTLYCYVTKDGIANMNGVYAYVTWDNNGPLVKLAYNVLSDQVNAGGIDIKGWKGVCLHEFTHLIQSMPSEQAAASPADRMMMQEGYADAIRTSTGGFTDKERLDNGQWAAGQAYEDPNRVVDGNPAPYIWQQKYQTSGNFMAWLRKYDGDFLRKLSASTKLITTGWSLESAVHLILGKDFDMKKLWDEYCTDVKAEAGK